jgi:DNA (cytosine-5)-methyltransferase 1
MSFNSAATSNASTDLYRLNSRPLRVFEFFSGVGGVRFGLEQANRQLIALGLPPAFEVVWANQFEPGCKHQHAARIYEAQWGHAPVNEDICEVLKSEVALAAMHALEPDILVAGFPCQDYSVARPTSQSEGLVGKKGVLYWEIYRLLEFCIAAGKPIQKVLLENVSRLIISPSACPGRDFAIILSSLQKLGYAVAWQVVNSGDFGFAQRRRRIFIVAVHESSPEWQAWQRALAAPDAWLINESPLARGLPVRSEGKLKTFSLGADVLDTQSSYLPIKHGKEGKELKSLFENAGLCMGGQVWTMSTGAQKFSDYSRFVGQVAPLTLGDVVGKTQDVPEEFFLEDSSLERWEFLKGAKAIPRVSATGFAYPYKEGPMAFPDRLDKPSRTVITSEGGSGASRTRHAVMHTDGRLRRLIPEELEELNGFPRGFTELAGVSDIKRAFVMGNALVTGVVACIGMALAGAI